VEEKKKSGKFLSVALSLPIVMLIKAFFLCLEVKMGEILG
jgi:hypothetical protein